ncbi:MAG TPA: NAD-dependent epimerase/dehydratase family protein [Planctomycetes bacterium]|nr:NAD-dependent epimerase/dehydratase family protein [Planctomycetota bacterium]
MRVLVTGAAGFIGSHLSELLVAQGHFVVALDDLSTGRIENLAALDDHESFRFVEGDCLDKTLVAKLMNDCDACVHLAAAVGVKLIVERPVHTIETNVKATEIVLETAAEHGSPVLLASTSEVYGKSDKAPFREDDDISLGPTTHSRWAYACSKALDEWLALAYARERGLPVTITRFFNTVGPRQTGRYGMVLPTFAAQALKGDPITVYGSGEQTRCFAHVRDVVKAVVRLLTEPSAVGRVFNVGTSEEVTISALAERVKTRAASASPIVFIPYEKAYAEGFEDMPRRVPDVTRLREALGFVPETPLDEIIDDVLADQRKRLEAPPA